MRRAAPLLSALLAVSACRPDPAPTRPPTPPTQARAPGVWTLEGMAAGAVKMPDLGHTARKVTTSSREAQSFFDQGLALAFGFNHDEAARSFAKAAALDPKCAMCWWGTAYVLGPNYNIPMLPDRAQAAWDAITKAQEVADDATPVERALVQALAQRYVGPTYLDPVAMQPYNEAYANAMREVAKAHPDDLDVQALFAESAMNVNPWKLWQPDGTPAPGTEEIVATLEGVLARDPQHVGANHFYIHAIEASAHPEKAEASADRLGALAPGAGHLVHMPAHVYQRVGRYADASEANRRAIDSDEGYLSRVDPPGYYGFYVGHNYGFLAYSASMEGRSAEALAAAKTSTERIPMEVVCGMPGMDFFLSEPLLVMVRFGLWSDILAVPAPAQRHQVMSGLWHHARGMALAATGDLAAAQAEVDAIRKIRGALPEEMLADLNPARSVLDVSLKVLEAKMAEVGHASEAIDLWQQAVALEDTLAYAEPADWFYPVRHYLGAALLEAGRAQEAEAVYREDLRRNPKNGWALFGLWQSLKAQKKAKAAKEVRAQFEAAWARADIELTRSAF
jgi:tetratricopeptide (TPR) repeat protein